MKIKDWPIIFQSHKRNPCQLQYIVDLLCESACFFLGAMHDDCIMSVVLIDILEPPYMDGIIMSLAGALI